MNAIEGKCGCGKCGWDAGAGGWGCYHPEGAFAEKNDSWVDYIVEEGYCPQCGCALGDDGIARWTVVVPEEPEIVSRVTFAGTEMLVPGRPDEQEFKTVSGPYVVLPFKEDD